MQGVHKELMGQHNKRNNGTTRLRIQQCVTEARKMVTGQEIKEFIQRPTIPFINQRLQLLQELDCHCSWSE